MSKIRCRNFPTFLLEGLYVVAQSGEEKYGTYDFLDREYTVNDHLDALKRHLMRFEDPDQDDNDEDSNRLHLYNIAWRALNAARVMEKNPERDDRYSPKSKNPERNEEDKKFLLDAKDIINKSMSNIIGMYVHKQEKEYVKDDN